MKIQSFSMPMQQLRSIRILFSYLAGAIGKPKFGHEDKTAILCETYKERLCTSEFSHMYF
jgi:hypothetical protein